MAKNTKPFGTFALAQFNRLKSGNLDLEGLHSHIFFKDLEPNIGTVASININTSDLSLQEKFYPLYRALEKAIKASKTKGIILDREISRRSEHDYYGFTISFTDQATESGLRKIIDTVIRSYGLKTNFADMDMTKAVDYWERCATRELKELQEKFSSVRQIIEEYAPKNKVRGESKKLLINVTAALDKLDAHVLVETTQERESEFEEGVMGSIRDKRRGFGFKSLQELTKHSLENEGGYAAREKRRIQTQPKPDTRSA